MATVSLLWAWDQNLDAQADFGEGVGTERAPATPPTWPGLGALAIRTFDLSTTLMMLLLLICVYRRNSGVRVVVTLLRSHS